MRTTVNAVENDLRRILRGDVEFDELSRHLYATDAGIYQVEPMGVVAPFDQEDVVRLVEYAATHQIPLVPRGAGSGLAGAAIGRGLIVDFPRHMNRILEFADDGSWVRVEPGLVMGLLNKKAKAYGRFFAPNPSSENYCSLGGMMGCNSSGSRSVAYGDTKDHVLGATIVLHGGEVFQGTAVSANGGLEQLLAGSGGATRALKEILPLLRDKQDVIRAAQPRVMKNASGYRVETVFDDEGLVHPHRLFIGAEGTLGLITEATLNLVPLPGKRAIAMAYFPTVFAAGEAVFPILGQKPTSLEIMDSNFLTFVRKNDPVVNDLLPTDADTALLVEFEAQDSSELDEKLSSLESLLAGGSALSVKRALDPGEQALLWRVRKTALPLMQKLPGPERIVEFVEDVTVHPDTLATYMSGLAEILGKHGADSIMYGHAGDGNIHTRPRLDMKKQSDLDKMQRIMDEVMAFVKEIKGTPSGEHGDGLMRSRYIREFYGDEVYDIFRQTKTVFDPNGIFNPGKKVISESETGGLATNLRYGPNYRTYDQPTLLQFPNGEYETEIEKCHGCAECKSLVNTSMCPTYKATTREHASPRAKANLLRNIIQGNLHPYDTYTQAAVREIEDYCIECGMCHVECPSNVNIPKLMLEAKSRYQAAHRPKPVEMFFGHAGALYKVGRFVAPVANFALDQKPLRTVAEKTVGLDRRRQLPAFHTKTFGQKVGRPTPIAEAALKPTEAPGSVVAFFTEVYADYNDPELGAIMMRLLEEHGVRVVHPPQKFSGILDMAYGFADRARATAAFNVNSVLPYVESGALVVSGEPTATFAFKVHYADYLDDPACETVAKATRDLGEFLAEWRQSHPEQAPAPSSTGLTLAYHAPCHLKTQKAELSFPDLLREIPDVQIISLDSGCCGMAGTFGTKAGSFEFSMRTGQPLFERVGEVKPDLVLSECSSCRMQIEQATGVRTAHPAELLLHLYGAREGQRPFAT
jgi:FAD/FMN-containing dehydrogenase/Fe-S oxidoreductase